MANIQNLIPINSHERAVALGRKGGSVKSAIKRWTKIKYCTQRCGFYGMCPFITASMNSESRLCSLKAKKVVSKGREVEIQPEVIDSFFRLFEKDGGSLLKEVLALVFRIRLQTDDNSIDELYKYIHVLIAVKKTFYGND